MRRRMIAALAAMCVMILSAGCADEREPGPGSSASAESASGTEEAADGDSAEQAASVSEEVDLDELKEENAAPSGTESLTTKVVKGVVIDATMNGLTLQSEDGQLMNFVYDMEVPVDDKDLKDGVRLGMGIEIAYTGTPETSLVAVKETDAETKADREALMEAGQLIFEVYNGYDGLNLSDAAKEAVLKTNLNAVTVDNGRLVLGSADGPGITMERVDYVWTATEIRP